MNVTTINANVSGAETGVDEVIENCLGSHGETVSFMLEKLFKCAKEKMQPVSFALASTERDPPVHMMGFFTA